MAQSPVKALKLYGVAASESRSSSSLADGTTAVHFRQVAAIVEAADYSKIQITPEELARYRSIVEEVHAHSPVLPAPPGTVFRSEDTLTRWLELHYFTIVEALAEVEGHSAARLALSVGKAPTDDEAAKKFLTLGSEALRSFRKNSAATITHPQTDEDKETGVITTASFLVETDAWQAFADSVAAEAKKHREFDFHLTGPWPPYDFVQMQFGG